MSCSGPCGGAGRNLAPTVLLLGGMQRPVPRHASALYSHRSRAHLPRTAPVFKQSEDQGRPQTLPSPVLCLARKGSARCL